ncbi:C-type lectin fold protein [Elysia marginata]|uniref:C-type lectin fold protein n=1 Tax=Elysia marginata TaxID=1093978 RepID=A0AAV4G8L7_9GAST|nr:C-type lectin fold protein [Elysia marginata]
MGLLDVHKLPLSSAVPLRFLLADELRDLYVTLDGSLNVSANETPYLILKGAIPEHRYYQCLVEGTKTDGSYMVVPSRQLLTWRYNYKHMESRCVENMNSWLEDNAHTISSLEYDFETTSNQFEEKYAVFNTSLELEEKRFDSLMPAFNTYIFVNAFLRHKLDIEGIGPLFYKDYVYYFSKKAEPFDIDNADQICQAEGGYLAELGDIYELTFLIEKIKALRWTIDTYFTGGNDIQTEGLWVYYHSKKPTPLFDWAPNNYRGNEDCMSVYNYRLEDVPCDKIGRFICKSLREDNTLLNN